MDAIKTLSHCVAEIVRKPAQWNVDKDVFDQYKIVLDGLGLALAVQVAKEVALNRQWRPTPFELYGIAADICSPVPVRGELFAEFWKAVCDGEHTPRWSHPLVGMTVRGLGGWGKHFYELHPHLSQRDERSIWWKQFCEEFDRASREWHNEIGQELTKSVGERRRELFPIADGAILALTPVAQVKTVSSRYGVAGVSEFVETGELSRSSRSRNMVNSRVAQIKRLEQL